MHARVRCVEGWLTRADSSTTRRSGFGLSSTLAARNRHAVAITCQPTDANARRAHARVCFAAECACQITP